MKKIRERCSGIDIGSREVFVSADGLDKVISFQTYTADLKRLVQNLQDLGIASVAMETTGVYWVILYELLEASGIDVWLVDGRQTKQVPGRKTDVKDCQWIHELHSYGLLNRCHVTSGQLRSLRTYQRLREEHIQNAARHVNHMHKALIQMNIRLPEVLSQVHGKSGLAIIRAILAGQRDKQALLKLCHVSIRKNKKEQILKALEGSYKDEQLFALKQAYEGFQFYQGQIEACDIEIEQILNQMNKGKPEVVLKNKKRKPIRHHKPKVKDLGKKMVMAYEGVDATVLPGVNDYALLRLLGEVGPDLGKWPTSKHFTSWLGLSPGQNHSGKKRNNASKKGHRRAGQIFRQIANNLMNTSKTTALGAFGRRLRARKGPYLATKAVARKLAQMFWRLMVHGNDFVERGIEHYQKQIQEQKVRSVKKLAKELNLVLANEIDNDLLIK